MRRKKELTLARLGLLTIPPVALLLVVAAGVGALSRWLAEPQYWQQYEQWLATMPRQELLRLSRSAEQSFVTWLMGPTETVGTGPQQVEAVLDKLAIALEGRRPLVVPGGEPRTLRLTVEQINAWLATNGRPWLDRHGLYIGGKIRNLMIAFEQRRPVLAFQVQAGSLTQIVSLVTDVTLPDAQTLHFKLNQIRGGTLGVRSGSLADPVRLLEDQLDEEQRSFLQQLRQGVTTRVPQVLQAAEPEQQIAITQLSIEGDGLQITLAGVPRP